MDKCYTGKDYDLSKNFKDYQIKIFQIAADVAKKSNMLQKHGCVIVHKKNIIATGYNMMCPYYHHSIHAEVNTLKKVKNNKHLLKHSEMYIVRIGKNSLGNPLKYSKPCINCEKCIKEHGIKKVFYSTNHEMDIITNYDK